MDILNFFKIIFAIIAIVATTYIFPIITAICCHEDFCSSYVLCMGCIFCNLYVYKKAAD